ncbi:tetratricopeptide repeat protein, partial [Cellulosimicrobium cellulans]|uniref:tetratricopeptide repeat protein n=1 Tax=Cellulosimicrobium cellulans TaxID=1710 RepID=UPI00366656BA
MSDALAALAAAVAAAPSSAPLRVHYASLLLAAGRPVEALEQASAALRIDPADGEALRLVQESAVAAATGARPATGSDAPSVPADPATSFTPADPAASVPAGGPATTPAGGGGRRARRRPPRRRPPPPPPPARGAPPP